MTSKAEMRKLLASQAISREDAIGTDFNRIHVDLAFAVMPCEDFSDGIYLQTNLMSNQRCDFCGSEEGSWLVYYFLSGRYLNLCMRHIRTTLRDRELAFKVNGEISAKVPNAW